MPRRAASLLRTSSKTRRRRSAGTSRATGSPRLAMTTPSPACAALDQPRQTVLGLQNVYLHGPLPSLPALGGGSGWGVVGHLDPQKPPTPIAHLLFRLFYQVEIRHRQLLQKQKAPLAGRRSRNDTMRLWRLCSC